MFTAMLKPKSLKTLLLTAMLALTADLTFAQTEQPASVPRSAPVVTAAASAERVRITASSNIIAIRLTIVNVDGQQLFDSGIHDGNVLDWRLPDGAAQTLAGTHLCVVTVRSLSGRTSRKLSTVAVESGQVTLRPIEAAQLTPAQTATLNTAQTDAAQS